MKTPRTVGTRARSSFSSNAGKLLHLGSALLFCGLVSACSGEAEGGGQSPAGPVSVPSATGGISSTGGRAGSSGAPASSSGGVGGLGGASASTCAEPQVICAGSCVNPQTDESHCGACGRSCPTGQTCSAGTCRAQGESCGNGLVACAGSCVDPLSDEAHCGGCGKACTGARECNAGTCECASGSIGCGGVCVNTQTSSAHCGMCNMACADGRACQGGSCVCPAGRQACGDACVDLQTDAEHCGTCDHPCEGTSVCTAGACTCATGQMLCGDSCADLQTSPENCGSCGMSCGLGQSCTAGVCSNGGGGALLEDGCQGLAQGVTLRQLAVYQTVKIPIVDKGQAVQPSARNADVVVGRESLFRVFIDVASGFSARSLSARLFIDNGGNVKTYYSADKPMIRGNSQEEQVATTFQIEVPKDGLSADARYSVEIVECGGTASGGVLSPRFPASDGAELGAVNTGVLKVHLVPVRVNSLVPDTSEAALAPYREIMLASYPITDIQFTVGETLEVGSLNWPSVLDDIRGRRSADRPASDVYYYGLVRPNATLREYCQRACTTGIGYVPQGNASQQAGQRVALGIGFSDKVSSETLAHEIGHNHGRGHTDCGGPDQPDPNYPYDNGVVGVYGYDSRQQAILPPTRTDIMGYCENKWFSDYTYQALLERVRAVSSVQSVYVDPASLSEFLVLLLDSDGPRWGHPIVEPSLPAGEAEEAEILDAAGTPIASVTVYRTAIADVRAWSIEVPLPEPGWHSLRVSGAPPLAFGKHSP